MSLVRVRLVHDFAAEVIEFRGRLHTVGFVKKSAMLSSVRCAHKRDFDLEGLNHVADVEMAT